MYVKTYAADTLDDALKSIKNDLGPDAIILKTVTNKGFKGTFKKNRIEITAAIPEKNYEKKLKVDHVMNEDEKQSFYNASADKISHKIDNFTGKNNNNYEKLGLNRPVKKQRDDADGGLDAFLNSSSNPSPELPKEVVAPATAPIQPPKRVIQPDIQQNNWNEDLQEQTKKIEYLEKKLFELTKNISSISNKKPSGIIYLRNILLSVNVEEVFIQNLIKKCTFEFSEEELDDFDLVFEFALREMGQSINVDLPLFSQAKVGESSVITLLFSETASGQTSTLLKLSALKPNSVLIQYNSNLPIQSEFTSKMLGIERKSVNSLSELISECRDAVKDNKMIFIDYKNGHSLDQGIDETKKIIDSLRRSFPHVESLLSLSAIHDELYNRRVMNKFIDLSDGLIFSHLDLCLNFGSLFNVHMISNETPMKFFATGPTVPEDIEAASQERLLGGIFKLNNNNT